MHRLVPCFVLFALVGCKSEEPPPRSVVREDVDLLLEYAKLPVRPVRAKFEVALVGEPGFLGPTDRRVLAVFEVAEEDVPKVIAGLEPSTVALRLENRDWFPPDVKAALETEGDAKGRRVLKGASYRAEPFTRMPYRASLVTRLEGSARFVLAMNTM